MHVQHSLNMLLVTDLKTQLQPPTVTKVWVTSTELLNDSDFNEGNLLHPSTVTQLLVTSTVGQY